MEVKAGMGEHSTIQENVTADMCMCTGVYIHT